MQLNLVATIRQEHWQYSGRVAPSDKAAWIKAFEGSCENVSALVDRAPASDLWGLFEQKSLPCWHRGRQVLIGDAAHAMLPNLAQGAAQGMEDGVVLAQLLAAAGHPSGIEMALSSFYKQRNSRVKKVQDGARWNLGFFHQQKSPLTAFRDNLMRLGGPLTTKLIGRKYHWLYCRSR
ncbi:MAG: FAD-dependent monooxygenase [Gammaproteobacteria bacterium]